MTHEPERADTSGGKAGVNLSLPPRLHQHPRRCTTRELDCRGENLGRPGESKIVFDYSGGSDRHLAWVGQIELAEDDLVAPDLAEEIFEDLNRQLLAWTPSISEAERCEAGIVTNRKALPVDNAENRPKTAIRDVCLASILDLETCDLKWASRKAHLLAFIFGNLGAGRNAKIP